MPHRADNLMAKACTDKNLENASKKARQGKKCKRAIKKFDKNKRANLEQIKKDFRAGTYKTSEYHHKKVFDPKERDISILPFFPDRVAQHALIGVLEKEFVSRLIPQTYACIKGRGIHAGLAAVRAALQDRAGTVYCLKLDVHHYYPTIVHQCMKDGVRRMIKDPRMLVVLDEIIDSEEGLPIGNYSSQYLANVYLDRFDHWAKETMGIKYYFRYVDDIVILSDSKEYLHELRRKIAEKLAKDFGLELKTNWQVFPVEARGIDFLGYVIRHDYVLLRKRTKQKVKKKLARCMEQGLSGKALHDAMGSYYGWLKHCDSRHLIQTLNNQAHEQIFK